MKKFFGIIALAIALALTGCSTVIPVSAGAATITENEGKSSGGTLLGLIFWGDASMAKAAKNGNITKVATCDEKITSILGLLVFRTTVVTGE